MPPALPGVMRAAQGPDRRDETSVGFGNKADARIHRRQYI